MLVAWPFCLCLLLGVWFCLEALYFSVLCFEKPPWFFGVWWVFTAGCGMLPVGFWFWVRLLVSGLAIPTGVAVTVAELSLNSVQQCSFISPWARGCGGWGGRLGKDWGERGGEDIRRRSRRKCDTAQLGPALAW